ncbi:MAG: Maf family protein [Pyrinomonadaceae bacterium]
MENDKSQVIELPKLVLASGSPRRSEILKSVGWEFEIFVTDIDESEVSGESPEDYVTRLAREKALWASSKHPGHLVLGADTTVVVNGSIIGKPVDLEDADRMIRLLSGKRHEVLTGVAFATDSNAVSGLQRTTVSFATLSDSEIDYLVHNGSPLDKAGAYAVQAQAALFIEEIEGDYWNVVGLPVSLVYKLLQRAYSEIRPESGWKCAL